MSHLRAKISRRKGENENVIKQNKKKHFFVHHLYFAKGAHAEDEELAF